MKNVSLPTENPTLIAIVIIEIASKLMSMKVMKPNTPKAIEKMFIPVIIPT